MRDPVYTSELEADRGELTDKMILNALDDIVYRLFDGQKVGYLTLRDFLLEQEDAGELTYRLVIECGPYTRIEIRDELEARLRKHLEGTELLVDYADDMNEEE